MDVEKKEYAPNSQIKFFVTFVLLYPGQLAWTASLLRDGAATAVFFLGLACCCSSNLSNSLGSCRSTIELRPQSMT